MADYESCDPTHLDDWLKEVGGVEFRQYTYAMLRSGVDRRVVRCLGDEHLLRDCGIVNGVHRLRILDAAKRQCPVLLLDIFVLRWVIFPPSFLPPSPFHLSFLYFFPLFSISLFAIILTEFGGTPLPFKF